MVAFIFSTMRSFRRTEQGGVLIFLALCLLPLTLILGLAVDSSFGLTQKRRLQMAVDAAAKAGAVNGGGSLPTTIAAAQKVFSVNTTNMKNISGPAISYDANTQVVTVSASITVPTYFMKLGGISSVNYNASASAIRYGGGSEVAIVLDLSRTTGQWTSKIISSLQDFVNDLPPAALVSIVPMATQI